MKRTERAESGCIAAAVCGTSALFSLGRAVRSKLRSLPPQCSGPACFVCCRRNETKHSKPEFSVSGARSASDAVLAEWVLPVSEMEHAVTECSVRVAAGRFCLGEAVA